MNNNKIKIKIERIKSTDFYYITVAAGEQLESEMAERGAIVALGKPEWFYLTRISKEMDTNE